MDENEDSELTGGGTKASKSNEDDDEEADGTDLK